MATKKRYTFPQSCTFLLVPFILIAAFTILAGICLTQFRSSAQSQVPVAIEAKIKPFDFVSKKFVLDGQEVTGDILDRTVSDDGMKAAAILIQHSSGSGTFYYLVGSRLKDGQEIYSTPVLLADRIEVSSVSVSDDGIILVDYLTHKSTEPMATKPTKQILGKYAFQDNGNLIEVLH